MKKIAVYGGSFNPVTKAHVKIINKIRTIVDEVIVVPVGDFYSKSNLINSKYRCNMLMNIKKNNNWDNVYVSRIEMDSKKQLKTYETLNAIEAENNNTETTFYFVLGADNLFEFTTWYKAEDILRKYNILAINRDNLKIENIISHSRLLEKYKDKIIKVDISIDKNVSSTVARNLISLNKSNEEILYQNVIEKETLNYINTNNLYKKD